MGDVYLFLGPEEGLKNDEILRMKKAVIDSHPECECYSFFVGDDDEKSYIAQVSQSSLFTEYRFIVLRNFESLKKSDEAYKATIEAIKDKQDDLTLIITSNESNKQIVDASTLKLIKEENIRIFWELKDEDKRALIYSKCRQEGFQITKDGVEEILNTIENNTEEIKSTIFSIASFLRLSGEKRIIDRDDIESYATRTKGESGYTLFKALSERNLDKALNIVNTIILNDTRDIIPALTVVSSQMRRLEGALRMKGEGKREDVIFKELTVFSLYPSNGNKKNGISFKERDTFKVAMRNYTLEEVGRIIILLGHYDSIVKSIVTDYLTLSVEILCYSIIVNKGKETDISLFNPSLKDTPL